MNKDLASILGIGLIVGAISVCIMTLTSWILAAVFVAGAALTAFGRDLA